MSRTVDLFRLTWIALALFTSATIAGDTEERTPAFPGAEGAGAFTSGGRGGQVCRVTNLNASGPGSLADAVSQPNRIVVFAVSGIIDVSRKKGDRVVKAGKIAVDQPHITIAGQTAPGEGICLKGGVLKVTAGDVIIRHIRSRRGMVSTGDMDDCIDVKPKTSGERTAAAGESEEAFTKRKIKKDTRGKSLHAFENESSVIIDHCSTSWATDENLTVTHVDRSTVQFCIAAEGLDYRNPNQTPPNHSEGSLWGSEAPDGRATMHHVLYAHNRLRNPRTTAGVMPPPVATFYNSVVYDWLEYASHTGSEAVFLNWLNSFYKPGPSTAPEARKKFFEFHGDPRTRLFASGNVLVGLPDVARDNRLGIGYGAKFRNTSDADKVAMFVADPFGEVPARMETAEQAFETVLDEAGATLPARDAVDLRIVNDVRHGTGRVIQTEMDLPPGQRWPDYHSLPAPADRDEDGIPDFWEEQFGLNPHDGADSAKIGYGGYANVEHYFNNTDPRGGAAPVVFVAATVSRACLANGAAGMLRMTRTGDVRKPLTVGFVTSGSAEAGKDYEALAGTVTLAAGKRFAEISVVPRKDGRAGKTVVVTLGSGRNEFHPGCPSSAMVVIRE